MVINSRNYNFVSTDKPMLCEQKIILANEVKNQIELKNTIKSTYYSIKTEWLSRISNGPEAKFKELQYYKLCISHFATCKWDNDTSKLHITFDDMISCLCLMQYEFKINSCLMTKNQISETFKSAQLIKRKSEPYQLPWLIGHMALSDIKVSNNERINPLIAEAFGKLCTDFSERVYPFSFEKALVVCDFRDYIEAQSKSNRPSKEIKKDENEQKKYNNFIEYWRSRNWEDFEDSIRSKHPIGTHVHLQSYFISHKKLLDEYFYQTDFRNTELDKIVQYLRDNPDIIIDLEAKEMIKKLNLTHDEWFFGLEKLAISGVIGAKVRWHFIGPATSYAITGEIIPPWKKIRRRVTKAIRKELLKRSKFRCQMMDCLFCNNTQSPSRRLHIDHLIPFSIIKKARVEPDANPENLRVLCAKLNNWKSNRPEMEIHIHRPLPPPLLTLKEWEDIKRKRRKKHITNQST